MSSSARSTPPSRRSPQAAGLRTQTVFGGVGQNPQVRGLRAGADIVVACPGRLEDLIGQGHCSLGDVEITVLDEADHMADLGFLPVGTPPARPDPDRPASGMLFSATLDKAIDVLVSSSCDQPMTHEADSAQAHDQHDGPPRAARQAASTGSRC